MLTAERLRELVEYDPELGLFRNLKTRGHSVKGLVLKGYDTKGYKLLKIDGKDYLYHRLVWLHVYGEWPSQDLDHKDRDKANNRIENLRLATESQNGMNCGMRRHNTSGYKGVYLDKGRWRAEMGGHKFRKRLGCFATKEEAASAYDRAAKQYFSEFVS